MNFGEVDNVIKIMSIVSKLVWAVWKSIRRKNYQFFYKGQFGYYGAS